MAGVSGGALTAAVLAGLAALVRAGPADGARRLATVRDAAASAGQRTAASRRGPGTRQAASPGGAAMRSPTLLAAGCVVAGAGSAVAIGEPLLGALAVPACAAALIVHRRRVGHRDDDAIRRSAAGVHAALAAELRAGAALPAALLAAGADAPPRLARRLLAAGRASAAGDAGAAPLLVPGDEVAAGVLRPLAAALAVTGTGAGLAPVLDRLAQAARADQRLHDALGAELAGPRATATLLAALPALGVLLAAGFGAHPLHLLLGTAPGLGCLLAGIALDLAGALWSARIVRAAARS